MIDRRGMMEKKRKAGWVTLGPRLSINIERWNKRKIEFYHPLHNKNSDMMHRLSAHLNPRKV